MAAQRRNRTARLGFENLESRQLMAGDVKVAVNGGDLEITGDSKANSIEVTHLGLDRYQVTGIGTTINGQRSSQIFRGVFDDVDIQLHGGNDKAVVKGAIPGDLRIYGHAGNDVIRVERATATEIEVKTGSGKDQVFIKDSSTRDDVIVDNNLYNAGDYDAVYVTNTRVGTQYEGMLKVSMHAGKDRVYIDRVSADVLYAHLFDGDDYLSVTNSTVRKDWVLDAGSGKDGLNRFANNTKLVSTGFEKITEIRV